MRARASEHQCAHNDHQLRVIGATAASRVLDTTLRGKVHKCTVRLHALTAFL